MQLALGRYEQHRNEAARPLYDQNFKAACLDEAPPQLLQLRAALRDNPEATAQFYGVNAGTVAARDFFAPANVQRIMARGRLAA